MATIVKNFARPVSSIQSCVCCCVSQRWNSNRAALTKPNRKLYLRMYQCKFVQPDGSTIRVRCHEPRLCIKIPVDIALLNEEELTDRYMRLAPPKKVKEVEEIDIEFDETEYSQMIAN